MYRILRQACAHEFICDKIVTLLPHRGLCAFFFLRISTHAHSAFIASLTRNGMQHNYYKSTRRGEGAPVRPCIRAIT